MPKDILSKAGALSEEERAIMRRLPAWMHEVLRHCPFLAPAAELVRSVHERFDGLGYPWALRGDEIPIGARIIAVSDACDTMTHRRVHSGPKAMAEAVFEIQRFRNSQFDGRVVDALFRVVSLHWHRGDARTPDWQGVPASADAAGPSEVPAP